MLWNGTTLFSVTDAMDYFPRYYRAAPRNLCSWPDRDLSMPDAAPCPFCSPDLKVIKAKNEFWYVRWDRFPASKGHMLVIPFRHVRECFDTTAEEKRSLFEMIDAAKTIIDEKYAPDGYNVGFNAGRVAGQGVMHCHVHIIPRYHGDTDNPHGGVRGVVRKWEH